MLVGGEQLLHPLAQGSVAATRFVQERLPLGTLLLQGGGEQRFFVHRACLSPSKGRRLSSAVRGHEPAAGHHSTLRSVAIGMAAILMSAVNFFAPRFLALAWT